MGFELTPPSGDQKAQRFHANDESGALDRSAILTIRAILNLAIESDYF